MAAVAAPKICRERKRKGRKERKKERREEKEKREEKKERKGEESKRERCILSVKHSTPFELLKKNCKRHGRRGRENTGKDHGEKM